MAGSFDNRCVEEGETEKDGSNTHNGTWLWKVQIFFNGFLRLVYVQGLKLYTDRHLGDIYIVQGN